MVWGAGRAAGRGGRVGDRGLGGPPPPARKQRGGKARTARAPKGWPSLPPLRPSGRRTHRRGQPLLQEEGGHGCEGWGCLFVRGAGKMKGVRRACSFLPLSPLIPHFIPLWEARASRPFGPTRHAPQATPLTGSLSCPGACVFRTQRTRPCCERERRGVSIGADSLRTRPSSWSSSRTSATRRPPSTP